ncbi:ABC transporter permease [Streptomyces sp. NPDC048664]|uniref:ABC transporter permease n=1 Tax=Streptomyces sp. NPDC048664 TaxID=3154505 RepID=UPI00343D15D5
MTAPAALTPAATRRSPTAPRQTRWLLRLHRPALCAWAVLVIAVSALLLWLWGPLTDAAATAWSQYDACDFSPTCVYDQPAILVYKDVYQYATTAVLALPFLIAAWAGATLTSRELETGTAQLIWAQSVPPARWLAMRLAVPAALTATGTSLLVALQHLASSAGQGRVDTAKKWFDPPTFYAGGPLTVALALAGLAAGALAGLAWRRSLPALVTSVLATGGVFGIVHLALPHLWPSVTRVSSLTLSNPAGSGMTVDEGVLTSKGARLPEPFCGSSEWKPCRATYEKLDAVSFYRDYHPLSHYWPLQLTGTALTLAIAALLTFATFHLLARRTGKTPPRAKAGT